jgi:hypothetical protein
MSNTVDIELLRSILDYDKETGFLFWKERPESLFSRRRLHGTWNTRWAGKRALTAKDSLGYYRGPIFGKYFRAHRVAWAIETGDWPPQIDHINGDRSDNRFVNLRASDYAQNSKNKGLNRNNTSGVLGVYWSNKDKRWVAQIMADGKCTVLGRFFTLEEAASARAAANVKYGFSENHGRAA